MIDDLTTKDYRLPFIVCGIDKQKQRHIIRDNGFSVYQLTLVTKGKGIYVDENGEKHNLERGTIYIFAPDVKHEYYGITDDFSTYWVNFDGVGVKGVMEYIGIENSCIYNIGGEFEYSKLYLTLEDIYKAYWYTRSSKNVEAGSNVASELDYNKYKETEIRASMIMYSLLGEVGIMVNRLKYGHNAGSGGEIAPVLAMIQQKYMENIGVTDMAECIGVSLNKIASLFKKYYGITPNQFLINTRLNYAEMFLRKMDTATIKQIAEMVGFSNSGYFIKVFKSKFGVTPESYRDMYLGK